METSRNRLNFTLKGSGCKRCNLGRWNPTLRHTGIHQSCEGCPWRGQVRLLHGRVPQRSRESDDRLSKARALSSRRRQDICLVPGVLSVLMMAIARRRRRSSKTLSAFTEVATPTQRSCTYELQTLSRSHAASMVTSSSDPTPISQAAGVRDASKALHPRSAQTGSLSSLFRRVTTSSTPRTEGSTAFPRCTSGRPMASTRSPTLFWSSTAACGTPSPGDIRPTNLTLSSPVRPAVRCIERPWTATSGSVTRATLWSRCGRWTGTQVLRPSYACSVCGGSARESRTAARESDQVGVRQLSLPMVAYLRTIRPQLVKN